jgi:hypothetical protein
MMGLKRKLLIGAFIPLALLLAIPFSLFPSTPASAAVADGANATARVTLYAYYKDMVACMASAIISNDDLGLDTNIDHVKLGQLVYGTSFNGIGGDIYGFYLNKSLPDIGTDDGTTTCTQSNNLIMTNGLKQFGLNGLDVVCAMGYTRSNGGACNETASTQGLNIGAPSNMLAKFKTQLRIAGWGVDKEPTLSNADKYELYSKSLILACTTGAPLASKGGAAADTLYNLKTSATTTVTYSANGDRTHNWSPVYIMQGDYARVNGIETDTCGQALDNANANVADAVASQACETKYSGNAAYISACQNGYSQHSSGNTLYCITAYPAPFVGSADHGSQVDTTDSLALRAACFAGQGIVGGQQCYTDLKYTTGPLHQACTLGAQYASAADFCTTSANAKIWSTDKDKVALLQACKDGQALNLTPDTINNNLTALTPTPGPADSTSCAIPSVGWIICPFVTFMAGISDGIYTVISGLLVTDVATISTSSGTYSAWGAIRAFANVGFVIVFLIIIFSQLTSVGISNYGVKKLLPRLIVVAILVNISFFLCQLVVDLSNIVGGSLPAIFGNIPVFGQANSLDDSGNTFTSIAGNILAGSAVSGAVGVAAIVVIYTGVGLLVPILLAAVLAVLVTVFILIARNVIIILLVAISPLAFLAMLLPNTENYFKQWRKIMVALLLVYPMIALLFGASKLASSIILSSGASSFQQLFGLAALFIPLFATPILLKNSLNAIPAIGNIASKLQSRTNGLVGRKAKEFGNATPIARGMAIRKQARANYRDTKFASDLESGGPASLLARGLRLNKIPRVGKYAKASEHADEALSRTAQATANKADSDDVSAATSEIAKMARQAAYAPGAKGDGRESYIVARRELERSLSSGDHVRARASFDALRDMGEQGLDEAQDAISAARASGNLNAETDGLMRRHIHAAGIKGADNRLNMYADGNTAALTSGDHVGSLTDEQFASQTMRSLLDAANAGKISKPDADRILGAADQGNIQIKNGQRAVLQAISTGTALPVAGPLPSKKP